MEITESLTKDLEAAPEWFESAFNNKPRVETLQQPLGKIKYQVWDRENASNVIVLIHGTGAHKKWVGSHCSFNK